MSAYGAFASVYDMMQYDVDYENWIEALHELAKESHVKHVLELACGTGTIGLGLAQKGYIVEGLDISEDMLTLAQSKASEMGTKMRFYHQDMICFNTKKQYDLIFSMCDGINYIVKPSDLNDVFKNVHQHLSENGLFIFDVSSEYKLGQVIGNNTFAETFENEAYIWENEYDEASKCLNFSLTLFKEQGGHYNRFEEFHEQRAYDIETLKKLIKPYFEVKDIVDGDTFESFHAESHRLCFVMKKK